MIVCDTGPLVAAAVKRDPDHHRSVELFTSLHLARRQIIVPAPIVAEVGYMLGELSGADTEAAFLESLAAGDFLTETMWPVDYARMAELVKKYGDMPLGTSDAAVLACAERLGAVRSQLLMCVISPS